MAGRGDPPEGTPEGLPGGEDEYRSVVFDEAFVRAAHLQEFSARERMGEYAQAVRSRPSAWEGRSSSRQAILLVLLILLAFGTAIYLGVRNPYQPPSTSGPNRCGPRWYPSPRRARWWAVCPTGSSTTARSPSTAPGPPASTCRSRDAPPTSPRARSSRPSASPRTIWWPPPWSPTSCPGRPCGPRACCSTPISWNSSTGASRHRPTTAGTPSPAGSSASTRGRSSWRIPPPASRAPSASRRPAPTPWTSPRTTRTPMPSVRRVRARARSARRPSSPSTARCTSASTARTCACTGPSW